MPATRRERTYECCVGAFQGKLANKWAGVFTVVANTIIMRMPIDALLAFEVGARALERTTQ